MLRVAMLVHLLRETTTNRAREARLPSTWIRLALRSGQAQAAFRRCLRVS
jgi:hypothetical protein